MVLIEHIFRFSHELLIHVKLFGTSLEKAIKQASSDFDFHIYNCQLNYISAEQIIHAVEEVRKDMNIPIFVQGGSLLLGDGYQSWDSLMQNVLPVPVCGNVLEGVEFGTPCCYIFTSGTTGNIQQNQNCNLKLKFCIPKK